MAILKALLVGKPQEYGDQAASEAIKKPWQSAIIKTAQNGEIYANKLGFEGDEVADKIHHGGTEKAVFANSLENYIVWEEFLGLQNLAFGAMGENLTISGLDENSVCVGDVHKIGSLVLQVSQPRKPCSKLSKRWANADMTIHIARTGLTGWYYRVVQAGSCRAGDLVEILERDPVQMSVMELNLLFHGSVRDEKMLAKFEQLTTLTPKWRDDLRAKLAGRYDTSYMKI